MPRSCEGMGESFFILDAQHNVLAHLAGRPNDDQTWNDACHGAADKLQDVRRRMNPTAEECVHRRGRFATLRAGISYGGGQTHPQNMDPGKYADLIQEILQDPNVRRISGFANSSFAVGAPKLYRYYEDNDEQLLRAHPTLHMPFDNSVHTAATFNLGPQTVTTEHVDSGNLPFGWCAIAALGNFDPRQGGHFILHQFKLIIEFPPNSLIHVPSGSVIHSNLPVRPHETRMSMTQYTAGPLFRWVAYGFRTERALAVQDPAMKKRLDAERSTRWARAQNYFSKYEALETDIREVFNLPIHKTA
ncbi:hypothetical protein BV25DRAFT_1873084 [Artomyces pyxidatus]|uniref:Uncharacterized protein n=1 Tax=Artomyces pyxidatus TaxID=48021 RepID=A0ACB8SGH5_9AGAM|nr:hypothetical protein BV25DRAFT_1873084 [Artomyces pyxidatus]